MSDQQAPRRDRWRIPPAAAIALAAAGAVAGGVAVAAIPGPGGVVYGCYRAGPGLQPLSVVDDPAACAAPNVLLPLNQTGPPGPAGAAGPAGALGPSTAYVTERQGGVTPTDKSLSLKKTTGTILSLNVPAGGRYLVSAKLSASLLGPNPASVACRLDAGSASDVTELRSRVAAGSPTSPYLEAPMSLALWTRPAQLRAAGAVQIRLRCTRSFGNVLLGNVKLSALRVGAVESQPFVIPQPVPVTPGVQRGTRGR